MANIHPQPLHRQIAGANGTSAASSKSPIAIDQLSTSRPFLYRVNAQPRWALICLVPKAGSTMWIRAFVRGLIQQGFPMADAPGKWHWQKLPYNTDVPLSSVKMRLMLVRHPISRLLSGYLGKIASGLWMDLFPSYNRSTGFAGFVRHLTAIDPLRTHIDQHFALQSTLCGVNTRGSSYRYLRVEEMGHWYREVVCALDMHSAVSAENIYWRNHYAVSESQLSSAEYRRSVHCFVTTQDCGCELTCHGRRCNASHVGTAPGASFGTFQNASERLEDYYDEDLAQRVNEWAAPDLAEFGYRPWRPGQTEFV